MNDLLRAHAGFDVVEGRFSLYCELSVRKGYLNGYVKPLIKGVSFYDAVQDRDKEFLQKVKERLVGALAWILKNRERGEVATKVDLYGSLDSPQFSTWEAVTGFLRNAFLRAILPGFDGR